MASVKPQEAEHFYEEDEDPARVFASFDAGQKGDTQRPGRTGPSLPWSGRLAGIRQCLARALRRAADIVEPHRMAQPGQRRAAHRPH
jgi:hypothetical protein